MVHDRLPLRLSIDAAVALQRRFIAIWKPMPETPKVRQRLADEWRALGLTEVSHKR